MYARALAAALACLLTASAASAAITDPELSCADWLKAGARKARPHHAAANREEAAAEARIRALCAANPKMRAMDAEMTVTGD